MGGSTKLEKACPSGRIKNVHTKQNTDFKVFFRNARCSIKEVSLSTDS